MAADSWSYLAAAASRRQQAASLESRFSERLAEFPDAYLGLEESDVAEDESRTEYACPFCSEDFDIVGLCFHIDDEHPVEATRGVCPLCATKVGLDLVGHLTMQHGNFFKIEHRRKSSKGLSESQTMLSLLKKDLQDGNLQSLFDGSSFTSAPNTAPDPLLSSFILNLPAIEPLNDEQPQSLDERSIIDKLSDEKVAESLEPSVSDKDQEERALRSEFVRGLMFSTIFEDESF